MSIFVVPIEELHVLQIGFKLSMHIFPPSLLLIIYPQSKFVIAIVLFLQQKHFASLFFPKDFSQTAYLNVLGIFLF